MKTAKVKKIKTISPAPAVKKPSKKATKKLSKSDPNYYSKIGQISARARKLSSEAMSEMAKRSHGPNSKRDGYHGGRRKKVNEEGTANSTVA